MLETHAAPLMDAATTTSMESTLRMAVWTRKLLPLILAFASIPLTGIERAQAGSWPRFRGENGSGTAEGQGIPAEWSPGDFAWNIELPGEGHGAPVIWEDRIFVTSAEDEGAVRWLFCIDAKTGQTLWSKSAGYNRSHRHVKGGWASSTPATDGQRVYVLFADREHHALAAYTFDGELVWRRSLGAFESQHGQGASPVVFEDLVIVPNDQDGCSSIVAYDSATGRTEWSALRNIDVTSYATPILFEDNSGSTQFVCSSQANGVSGLDPRSGRTLWTTGPLPARTVSSPVLADGLVFQTCGGGGQGKGLVAVDPTTSAKDDVVPPAYSQDKEIPYVPTPVAHDGHVYLIGDRGVARCIEASTGKNIWTKRLGGNYSGSPVCIDGKIFIISEEGEVVVLPASPEFVQPVRIPLGDPSHSTPAVADGRLVLRTFHRLFCLDASNHQ